MALINIPIVDDTVVESDEIFTAVLSAEENAILNDNSVTITIIDLDSKCNFLQITFRDVCDILIFCFNKVHCPNFTDVKNGGVILSGVSENDRATFTCNDGYELVGDSSLICLSGGTWDSSPPVCQGPTGNRSQYDLPFIAHNCVFFGITS